MKKGFLLASIVVLMSSCTTLNLPKPYTKIRMVDYSWLTEQGIFVTESNSVSFDYLAVGSISVESSSGYEPTSKNKNVTAIENGDGIYTTYLTDTWSKRAKFEYYPVSLEDMFGELNRELKEKGANGIVNFKIDYDRIKDRNIVRITGMAIRK